MRREAWLAFFLDGVHGTGESAVSTAERLSAIFQEDRGSVELTGRRAGSALRVHEALKGRPILTLSAIRAATGLAFPAVSSGMDVLVNTGITRELTGRRRNRVFVYDRYLAILNEGTQLGT